MAICQLNLYRRAGWAGRGRAVSESEWKHGAGLPDELFVVLPPENRRSSSSVVKTGRVTDGYRTTLGQPGVRAGEGQRDVRDEGRRVKRGGRGRTKERGQRRISFLSRSLKGARRSPSVRQLASQSRSRRTTLSRSGGWMRLPEEMTFCIRQWRRCSGRR